jgi:hypothetical protein
MERLTRMTLALLRSAEPLLPAEHRTWAQALRTEAAEVPAGWDRLVWLAGGVRFTLRSAALNLRLGYPLIFAAAAVGTAWTAWSGPPGDPAIAINRVDVIAIAVILAGLPWAVRRARGPGAAGWPARTIRVAGYLAILALILVKAAVERTADAAPNNLLQGAVWTWTGEITFLAVMACYAVVLLAGTARRSPAAPASVRVAMVAGTGLGVLIYLLGPLGFPLRFTGLWPVHLYDAAIALGTLLAVCAPVATGLRAARRAAGPMAARIRQGAMAGLCTGVAAALVVTVLSTATIALLPHDAVLRNWAAAHIGHWTPILGPVTSVTGPRLGYVAGNSSFAAGFLVVLLFAPLAGCAVGALAGRAATGRPG